ncbi:hypothetical protein LCGC14_0766600 [marine sediment metagenome]|uniref:Probable pectate lyase C n=1 Tax=marine sediment metagenome TaxID=412755 RepID=A0A0F9QJD2_9ZZZZ
MMIKKKQRGLALILLISFFIISPMYSTIVKLSEIDGPIILNYFVTPEDLRTSVYVGVIRIDELDPGYTWADTVAKYGWITGNGTVENPYIIENVTCTISIDYSDAYFIIRNCTVIRNFGNPYLGTITLYRTSNGIIEYNDCSGSLYNGISLIISDNNTVRWNDVSNSGWSGVLVVQGSDYNTVIGNNASFCDYQGIYIDGRYNSYCTYNYVAENIVNNNEKNGIHLDHSTNYNIIHNNTVKYNKQRGILVETENGHTSYNNFTSNIVEDNFNEGLYFWGTWGVCVGNLISGNYFISNNGGNGRDDGSNNIWNKSLMGNYWSNYGGRDQNDDGIGDTPYNIPGSAGSQDQNPIWTDGIESFPYFIDELEDFSMTEGDESVNITWSPKDINKNYDSYQILQNGTQIVSDVWFGSQIIYTELFSLAPGIFNFTCVVRDTDGFSNYSMVIINIMTDIFEPEINIIYPTVNSLFGNETTNFEIAIIEPNLDSTWYCLNGSPNYFFSGLVGTINQQAWDAFDNGTVDIEFYANDTFNNIGMEVIRVRKDTRFPELVIISPTSSQLCGNLAPYYNISLDESKLDAIWYSLNGGFNYTITELEGFIDQAAWNLCGNGTVNMKFYANNSVGNEAFIEVTVRKDILNPVISVISPEYHELFGNNTIEFELTINEPNLDSTWYSLNGGPNYFFTGLIETINQQAWDACGNGTVNIQFYANDTLGNSALNNIIVRKDNLNPVISIISPEYHELFGNNTIEFELTISEPNLDTAWYSLNGGPNYFFSGLIGTINQQAWDACGNGTVNIQFFANDTLGHFAINNITVRKDNLNPVISIISPEYNEFLGNNTFDFELTIIEPNLDSTWYFLNGGPNYFFSGLIGTINQQAWDACGNGTVNIQFYANDTLGHFAMNNITVRKDIFIPGIIINLPSPNQFCGILAPSYNVTIIGNDIDTCWYRVNDTSVHEFTGLTGLIEQQTWDIFSDGLISIKFFANNSFGHYSIEEVWVLKRTYLTERNAYAIVIGISDYPGTSNDLSYCDDDANGIYNMLISDYNFRSENIIYLQDSSASKTDINNAFDSISSVLNPDDIFFFYYSGHGGRNTYNTQVSKTVESLHPYWNNYDQIWSISHPGAIQIRVHFERFQTESVNDYALLGGWGVTQGYYDEMLTGNLGYNFWSSYIPVSRYYIRFISDSSNFNPFLDYGFKIDKYEAILEDGTHFLSSYDSIPNNPSANYIDTLLDSKLDSLNCSDKYVILDSCNSGGLIPEVQDIGRYIMTACSSSEESLEIIYLEHGIFTNYLLESQGNANDLNGDGVLSLEEIYSYVYSNTVSYSGSFGSEYTYHPQESDGIIGESVLYPSIGSVSINSVDNQLFYSFYLYGHGLLRTLNITVLSISPTITYKTVDIKNLIISPTGFGYYSGLIELQEGYIAGGIQILAEIEGNQIVVINLTIGDSDGDGLTDFFEVLEGGGLDPTSNDTDSDGLSDFEEFYGLTDPLNNDSDSDGLLDGEEINIYGTNPLLNDSDLDGLSDGDEINIHGTNPLTNDTDSDGLFDSEEINIYFTNPLNNDTDSDNLFDLEEILLYNTDPLNHDTDSDSLTDGDEVFIFFTDPLLADTDSDGLTDGDEINIYSTDPLSADTDSDGLTDGDELNTHNTDPTNDDTDLDTLPDGWEVINLLDPLTNDSALDPDNDLLTNLEEFQFNTHPFNNDTDSDGLLDGVEVNIHNTDPLQEDSDSDGLLDGAEVNIHNTDPLQEDTDSDGLFDGEEVNIHNTDPLQEDTDLDLMPDKWEVDNLLNPLVNDTMLDPDTDLLMNILEYQLGTNPQDPDTDDDGWIDGDEVLVYDTDPLDPDDHPNPRQDQAIPGYSLGFILFISAITITILRLKYFRFKDKAS